MPLTPIDIQQKTFGPELRGYNMDEVDDFLDEVVTALKDYDQRVRDAQDRIRALEAELSTRGEDESAISRALVAAQKQADALVTDAHSDAERIREDAQVEADRLRADRDAERMSLQQDIARMRATIADLKRRVAELAASVSDDLDSMDESAATASTDMGGDLTPAVGYQSAVMQEDQPVADAGAWQTASDLYAEDTEAGDPIDVWADAVDETLDDDVSELDELDTEPEAGTDLGEDIEDTVDDAAETVEQDTDLTDEIDEIDEVTEDALSEDVVDGDKAPGRRPWERGSV